MKRPRNRLFRHALSWETADLIRDFLNLTLEMVPLGDSFQTDIQLFAKSPASSLSGLSTTAYLLHQLCTQEWNARQLTASHLAEWRKHATTLIKIKETGITFVNYTRPSPRQLLHFVAAFISAIRNAIKNSEKKECPNIVVTIEQARLVVENTYKSSLDNDEDRQPYVDKQQQVWISSEAKVGSEQVLARHASRMLPELYANRAKPFISKTNCIKLANGGFRHSWTTIIPHPFLIVLQP